MPTPDPNVARNPDLFDVDGLEDLVPVRRIIAAGVFGALIVATGFGWWVHHTFVVPTHPRRTTTP